MMCVMFVKLGIGVEKSVPPGECRSIVANKIHVVEVMETSSSIEWNQMQGVQRNVVTTVNINGFKQPESDPGPEQNHVIAEDHDANEESSTQNQSLSRVGIFCLHAKWSSEVMMDFMNVLVDSAMM